MYYIICNFITVWECVDIYRSESDICLHVRLHNFHHNVELLFIHFIQSSQYCGGCWWNHFFLSLSALFIYGGLGVQNYTLHTHCICKLQTIEKIRFRGKIGNLLFNSVCTTPYLSHTFRGCVTYFYLQDSNRKSITFIWTKNSLSLL